MKKLIAGISVLAVVALGFAAATQASANDDDEELWLIVKSNNSASVTNAVSVSSDTGYNRANAYVGNTNEEHRHHSRRGPVTATGGMIVTGDALAQAELMNQVNTNTTEIRMNEREDCDCDEWTNVKVKNYNSANVTNAVTSLANTGHNQANADVYGHRNGTATGGSITTGMATSWAGVTNVVNSNWTKIVK